MKQAINRPIHLDLLKIRQPVTAVVSILHRISGVLLVLLLPLLIYAFDISLRSVSGFAQLNAMLHNTGVKGVGVILMWVLAHHLFAGVRFLLLDFHVGISKHAARRSAWLVHGAAAVVAILTLGAML